TNERNGLGREHSARLLGDNAEDVFGRRFGRDESRHSPKRSLIVRRFGRRRVRRAAQAARITTDGHRCPLTYTERSRCQASRSDHHMAAPQRTPSAIETTALTVATMLAAPAEPPRTIDSVTPMKPREPGTRSQNPGRNVTSTGGPPRVEAT